MKIQKIFQISLLALLVQSGVTYSMGATVTRRAGAQTFKGIGSKIPKHADAHLLDTVKPVDGPFTTQAKKRMEGQGIKKVQKNWSERLQVPKRYQQTGDQYTQDRLANLRRTQDALKAPETPEVIYAQPPSGQPGVGLPRKIKPPVVSRGLSTAEKVGLGAVGGLGVGLGGYAGYQGLSGQLGVEPEAETYRQAISPEQQAEIERELLDFENATVKALTITDTLEFQPPAVVQSRIARAQAYINSIDVKQWPAQMGQFLSQLMTSLRAQLASLKASAGRGLTSAKEAVNNRKQRLLEGYLEWVEARKALNRMKDPMGTIAVTDPDLVKKYYPNDPVLKQLEVLKSKPARPRTLAAQREIRSRVGTGKGVPAAVA